MVYLTIRFTHMLPQMIPFVFTPWTTLVTPFIPVPLKSLRMLHSVENSPCPHISRRYAVRGARLLKTIWISVTSVLISYNNKLGRPFQGIRVPTLPHRPVLLIVPLLHRQEPVLFSLEHALEREVVVVVAVVFFRVLGADSVEEYALDCLFFLQIKNGSCFSPSLSIVGELNIYSSC